MAPRHQAALAYLGRRFSERGGFLTPRDYRAAAVIFSGSTQECADLERWLARTFDGARSRIAG